MASGFSESSAGLHYAEHISVPMRLFVGLIGLAMFLIPVPFVMHTTTQTPWPHLLLVAVCVVAACAMGALFLTIALGRVLTVHFDPATRQVRRTSRWPLVGRTVHIAFARIAPPEVVKRTSEDGPYHVLRLTVHGERPLHLGGFDRREDAERWRSRIAALLESHPG